ncbi:mannose-P-dolichol utilization defect 1 protein homolog isoform X2 [Formica exsecta]|uniref:mannose-P-dolichol utilization defect 1 protein homolog isoform X2 n=1 Tax=Formica exsecta TaxID=72781 RepID=UPI001144A403|nr:mannose-P-dolichol utilization defect 1 protein homolog isoform X2 [Formica exsecta]
MAQFLKKAALLLFSQECMKEYWDKFNFLHVACFKVTLSKFVGLSIVGGSLLVKVPQIMKILKSKSGKGINVFSIFLDLFAITATLSYSFMKGFPFSAWGDAVFLACQTSIIAVLVMHYNGDTAKATAFLSAYLAVVFAANSGLTPIHILWACQSMNIPIVLIVFTSLHKLFQWKYRPIIGGNMFYALLRFSCENFYFYSRHRRYSYDNNVYVFYIGKWYNSDAASLLLEHRC